MAIRERKNIGPQGLADVKVLTKSVRVAFQGGETFDLPLDSIEKGRKSGIYNVSMTATKDKIYLKPVNGQYMLKFKQMGYRVNELPTNKVVPARVGYKKDGGTFPIPSEIVFSITVEVVGDGPYAGLTSTTRLPYSFAPSATGVGCDFYDSGRNIKILEQAFRVIAGIDIANDNVDYFDNPSTMLLSIERRWLEADKTFMGSINDNGFLDGKSLSNLPADFAPPKKKKATKKSK